MAKSMKLGGGRFAKRAAQLKRQGLSEKSAKAEAAYEGRRAYGAKKMAQMAAAGRRRAAGKKGK